MTDPHPQQPAWLYYKLYLAEHHDRSDQALLQLGAGLRQLPGCARWFFIRYVDLGGMHLRVRVLPRAGHEADLRAAVTGLLERVAGELASYAGPDYVPMVTTPEMGRSDKRVLVGTGGVRIESAVYEPEHEKYGARAEMPIAEQLFMASSQVALAILEDEAAGRYTRKTLVPHLMRAGLQCFDPAPAARFWNHYALFWLGGASPAAADWHGKFMSKGAQLRGHGLEVCGAEDALAPGARRQLDAWRGALARARRAYLDQPQRSADIGVLCFNFVHMMNNRLGLASLEESYMATLLEQAEQVPA